MSNPSHDRAERRPAADACLDLCKEDGQMPPSQCDEACDAECL
ncbi:MULTISPECIES: hypothetical protein [Sorangium]